jgi:Skp family chaperone for outer membrane proteins
MTIVRIAARTLFAATLAAGLTACSNQPKSNIGLIDTDRITSNWPKFLNYQNQIQADQAAIARSNASIDQKRREVQDLEKRYVAAQDELTQDVKTAAEQVAKQKNLKYVFTRQYVGYGGVDITPDVEKALDITEKSPAP